MWSPPGRPGQRRNSVRDNAVIEVEALGGPISATGSLYGGVVVFSKELTQQGNRKLGRLVEFIDRILFPLRACLEKDSAPGEQNRIA
jgi:hypothetical protein